MLALRYQTARITDRSEWGEPRGGVEKKRERKGKSHGDTPEGGGRRSEHREVPQEAQRSHQKAAESLRQLEPTVGHQKIFEFILNYGIFILVTGRCSTQIGGRSVSLKGRKVFLVTLKLKNLTPRRGAEEFLNKTRGKVFGY